MFTFCRSLLASPDIWPHFSIIKLPIKCSHFVSEIIDLFFFRDFNIPAIHPIIIHRLLFPWVSYLYSYLYFSHGSLFIHSLFFSGGQYHGRWKNEQGSFCFVPQGPWNIYMSLNHSSGAITSVHAMLHHTIQCHIKFSMRFRRVEARARGLWHVGLHPPLQRHPRFCWWDVSFNLFFFCLQAAMTGVW